MRTDAAAPIGLRAMLQDERPSAEAIAMLRADPRFAEAARAAASGIVALYQGNRLLNTLVNDRGRMMLGFIALYLHYHRDPADPLSALTASRIKQLCVEQQICSAGRAEAMLVLMRLFGYLEPAASTGDRRVRALVATDRLVAAHHERWERICAAVGQVIPEVRDARDVLRRDDFSRAFVGSAFAHLQAGFRFLNYAPELALFADRNSGMMIMFSLLTASGAEGQFPPERPVTVSISALSRKFGVSRVHVRKLLRDAEAQKLVTRGAGGDDQVVLLPRLKEAALNFFATLFLFVTQCAGEALDAIGTGAHDRTA